jgi:hypothetical protein
VTRKWLIYFYLSVCVFQEVIPHDSRSLEG